MSRVDTLIAVIRHAHSEQNQLGVLSSRNTNTGWQRNAGVPGYNFRRIWNRQEAWWEWERQKKTHHLGWQITFLPPLGGGGGCSAKAQFSIPIFSKSANWYTRIHSLPAMINQLVGCSETKKNPSSDNHIWVILTSGLLLHHAPRRISQSRLFPQSSIFTYLFHKKQ